MTIIEQYRQGKISISQLRDYAAKNPELRDEINAILEEGALHEHELERIAGGAGRQENYYWDGNSWQETVVPDGDESPDGEGGEDSPAGEDREIIGTDGDDTLSGESGNDTIHGLGGQDTMSGMGGNDYMDGGDGDDTMDGGDGSDHMWGGDGDDTLSGGDGDDTLNIHYDSFPDASVQHLVESNVLNVELLDEDGNLVEITDSMWDESGNLILPAGVSGTLFSQDGGRISFSNVETLTTQPVDGVGYDPTHGEKLVGTDGDDYLAGSGLDDTIKGLGGDDDLLGFEGDDTLDGGYGNDDIYGHDGDDLIKGGHGNDTIGGGPGHDTIHGNEGDDYIISSGGDLIHGGEGDDTIVKDPYGVDKIEDSRMYGGDGDDLLKWTFRGGGEDSFSGGEGNDSILLLDTPADETVRSMYESGYMTLELNDGDGNPITVTDDMWDESGNLLMPDGASGTITHDESGGVLHFTNVEKLYTAQGASGGEPGETLIGTEGDDLLEGDDGDDTIKGLGGNDILDGHDGDDVISGGTGEDVVYGGDGHDRIEGGDDQIDGGSGLDMLYGEDGDDTMQGGDGQDLVHGGDGNDVLDGGDDDDMLSGGDGDDYLQGGAGNDNLVGGEGSDTLDGGSGNDFIESTESSEGQTDYMNGGTGDDTIGWTTTTSGHDYVDGGDGNDRLYVMADPGQSVHDLVSQGQLTITLTDADGNPVAITDDMWDENGNLIVPDGASGVATGPEGDTVTFTNVEILSTQIAEGISNEDGEHLIGTEGGDTLIGGEGNDTIEGHGAGDDLQGAGGDDSIDGGAGNDTIDQRTDDGMNDLATGGAGNDVLIWSPTGSGDDVFDGGEGDDQLAISYDSTLPYSVHTLLDDGVLTIELTDGEGNPLPITDDMWDEYGNLHLPEGTTGIITGQSGDTLRFSNVETLTVNR